MIASFAVPGVFARNPLNGLKYGFRAKTLRTAKTLRGSVVAVVDNSQAFQRNIRINVLDQTGSSTN